jgi:hypothetical protein
MERQGKIVTYTTEELQRMPSQTDWAAVQALTDEEIEAAIANDPDAGEIDETRLEDAIVQTPIRFEWQVWQWLQAQGYDVHALVNDALQFAMAGQKWQLYDPGHRLEKVPKPID